MPDSELAAAFHACVRADAALATIMVSGRGDINSIFHEFYKAFKVVYLLVLNNTKFREAKYGDDDTLADAIQAWFENAKDRKDARDGLKMFREFNLTMGRLGLLK